jgi:hypothetical protein
MKSITERCNKFAEKNPNWSSYLCFAEVLKHHKYNRKQISYWFNKLVDPDDYAKSEKRQIIDFLVNLANSEVKTK